jgi:hypothetical protein
MGSTEREQPYYHRIQVEDFVYEHDNAIEGGNHVHTVWRDRAGDFGADLLGEHYEHAHNP